MRHNACMMRSPTRVPRSRARCPLPLPAGLKESLTLQVGSGELGIPQQSVVVQQASHSSPRRSVCLPHNNTREVCSHEHSHAAGTHGDRGSSGSNGGLHHAGAERETMVLAASPCRRRLPCWPAGVSLLLLEQLLCLGRSRAKSRDMPPLVCSQQWASRMRCKRAVRCRARCQRSTAASWCVCHVGSRKGAPGAWELLGSSAASPCASTVP